MRGTPYNTGEVLRAALALGAAPYGNWSGCHAIQWDRDAPWFGDLEITNRFSRQSYPVGIVVNLDGERFIDEGADFRNYTYAKYGAEVLRQPSGVAFQLFDQRSVGLLRHDRLRGAGRDAGRGGLASLASALGIDCRALSSDGRRVQRGVVDRRRLRPGGARRRAHRGARGAKSNWALPLDSPPFVAFPVTCGITFTFGGLHVDADARVLDLAGAPIPGLYAAGELVGGLFFHNYPGGSGLTAGTVYGRRAGCAAVADTA